MNAKPPLLEHVLFVADANLEAAGEDVDRLLLRVVDVERRPAVRRHLHDEVVEGAAGLVAGDLEDEVTPGAGLAVARPSFECEELGTKGGRHEVSLLEIYLRYASIFA